MIRRISMAAAAAAAMLLFTSCGNDAAEQPTAETEAAVTEAAAVTDMTIEEKVAQLFMVRCDAANMDAILEKQPGGIVMFGVDFEGLTKDEVKDKIESYKDACVIEPIISVDEEGGTVVRVSSNPNLAGEKYQNPRYYYELGGIEALAQNAAEKSDLLADLGITMNLAPVADVSTDPDDFIYDRALGEDAATTAEYVSAVVGAMKEHGMMSCLKHFPGYGGNVDTHTGIAIDDRPLDSFYENDFVPFEAGIEAGADAVLVAHNIVNSIDSTQPASISGPVHEILREELGCDGIIMTDDMSMEAMAQYETPYTKAVLAGNDMVIVTDFEAAYNEVLGAAKDGTIPESTIDAAVERILEAKGY